MVHHPDRNKDDIENAKRKFQDISEAFEVLFDKQKREIYDQENVPGGGEPPPPGATGFPPAGCISIRGKGGRTTRIVPIWPYRTLEIERLVFKDYHRTALAIMKEVGASYESLGRNKEGERVYKEIMERHWGPNLPHMLRRMDSLASSYEDLGRSEEATQLYKETLEIQQRVLGPKHPDTLWTMNRLAPGPQKIILHFLVSLEEFVLNRVELI
jgi:Tetratricopeptide repeat/DnaJ domain